MCVHCVVWQNDIIIKRWERNNCNNNKKKLSKSLNRCRRLCLLEVSTIPPTDWHLWMSLLSELFTWTCWKIRTTLELITFVSPADNLLTNFNRPSILLYTVSNSSFPTHFLKSVFCCSFCPVKLLVAETIPSYQEIYSLRLSTRLLKLLRKLCFIPNVYKSSSFIILSG